MKWRVLAGDAVPALVAAASDKLVAELSRRGHDAALLPVQETETLSAGDVAVTWNGAGARSVPDGVKLVCLLQMHPMHVRGLLFGRSDNVLMLAPARSWETFLERHGTTSVSVLHAPLAPPLPHGGPDARPPGGRVAVWGNVEDPARIWRQLESLPSSVLGVLEEFRAAAAASPRESLHELYRGVLDGRGIDVPAGRWREWDHTTFGRYAEVVEAWVSAVRFNALVTGLDAAGLQLTLVGRGFDTLALRRDHRHVDPADPLEALTACRSAGVAAVRMASPDHLDLASLQLLAFGVPLLAPPSQPLRRLFDGRGGIVHLERDSMTPLGDAIVPLLRDPVELARRSVHARATVERNFTWHASAGAILQAATSSRTGRATS